MLLLSHVYFYSDYFPKLNGHSNSLNSKPCKENGLQAQEEEKKRKLTYRALDLAKVKV